jgi:hypothetical protein
MFYPGMRLRILNNNHEKSDRIAGLRANIWTRDLPNTKQEFSPLDHDIRSYLVESYNSVEI